LGLKGKISNVYIWFGEAIDRKSKEKRAWCTFALDAAELRSHVVITLACLRLRRYAQYLVKCCVLAKARKHGTLQHSVLLKTNYCVGVISTCLENHDYKKQ